MTMVQLAHSFTLGTDTTTDTGAVVMEPTATGIPDTGGNGHKHKAAIGGGVAGGLVFLALLAYGVYKGGKKFKKANAPHDPEQEYLTIGGGPNAPGTPQMGAFGGAASLGAAGAAGYYVSLLAG